MTVIVARHFDNHLAAGETTGETDRAHRGFRTRVHQAQHLDRRDGRDDQLGQLVFSGGRRAEAERSIDGVVNRRDDLRMLMAKDHWPPGADVVDVAVAIDVEEIGAVGALEDDWFAADPTEGPRGTVHAAGHELLWPLKNLVALVAVWHRVWHYNGCLWSAFRCFWIGRARHVGSP